MTKNIAKIGFAALILLAIAMPFSVQSVSAVQVSEGVKFQTTGTNTTFVMGSNFTFDRIEVHSTYLMLGNANISVQPSVGSINFTLFNFTIEYRKWNESCSNRDAIANHTMGGLKTNTPYVVKVNGAIWEHYMSNDSGYVFFTYSGGYSDIATVFEMEETKRIITVNDDGGADYTSIQDAINNASDGDLIEVWNGTYTENVNVNKQLTVYSRDGADVTIIPAANPDDHVFDVIADYVNISGFTVQGATASRKAGIYLGSNVDHCNISYNIASNNFIGIYLYSSSYNLIYNNYYFNNTDNVYDDGTNIWNITKTAGTNIVGGPYLGGNYWSDYLGKDTNGDGLGDTLLPYNSSGAITNGGDWHPLVHISVSPTKIIYPDFTDTDTPGNWRTWMGVMNTGDASTTLNLTIYNPDGSLAYSNPNFVTLEPKAAHFFRPGITAGIAQGSAIVYGDNLAGTCHVNKNGGEGTKVYTALSNASSTLYYPDFTDTDTVGNWRTWIAVMNTGDTSTTVRLDVYNTDGSVAYSNPNFVTLEPKAVHFFRPGITAGIAQGDAVVSGDNLAGTCHVNKNGGEGTKVYTAIGG
ncbi:MAG: hypothetical protein KAT65_30790 [Methanophagales archaeon]|nr:hypothetical protein [Methanophagales archaeon]